jgi:hypothetical protein
MRRHKLFWNFVLRNSFAPAFAVVDAVIKSLRKRIFAHRAPGVVGHVMNIRREKTLIRLMHARGDIRPPEKRLGERRAIVSAHFQFQRSAARMQANAVHAFHPAHRVVVAAPDCF